MKRFIQGASEDELQDTTALTTSGILDSLGTVVPRKYLEKTSNVTLKAHEADKDHLGTRNDSQRLVQPKRRDVMSDPRSERNPAIMTGGIQAILVAVRFASRTAVSEPGRAAGDVYDYGRNPLSSRSYPC